MVYPWQLQHYERLLQSYRNRSLPHALLLTGLPGMGKMDFARHLAQLVLCEQKLKDPCGHCRSCHWFVAGSHPDMLELSLEEKSKVIKIDQVRWLTEKLQKTAQGNYRVALISPADQMNQAAANALLKTLEEPAGQVLILLLAAQPQRLPATIRSRCQKINFTVDDPDIAIDWLRMSNNDSADSLLLQHAFGAPLLVSKLRESAYLDLRDQVFDLMKAGLIEHKNIVSSVPALLKLDIELLLRAMISIVCDLLKLCFEVGSNRLINLDRLEAMQQICACLQAQALGAFYLKCLQSKEEIESGAHLNVQLIFEALLLNWMSLNSN